MADVYVVNSGYRTRYPHVAIATNRPAGREEGPALEGRHDRIYRDAYPHIDEISLTT
jgi:hypothetical protein